MSNNEPNKSFLQRITSLIVYLVSSYENTILYCALGWFFGCVFYKITIVGHIPILGWETIPARSLGLLIGAILGMKEDKRIKKERATIQEVVSKELEKARLKNQPNNELPGS
jgi:hypothetical protein